MAFDLYNDDDVCVARVTAQSSGGIIHTTSQMASMGLLRPAFCREDF